MASVLKCWLRFRSKKIALCSCYRGHDERIPALAPQLQALHRFEEDLKEGLGLISLYNEGLGTTSDLHLYDRVRGRDAGVHRPWERKPLPAS